MPDQVRGSQFTGGLYEETAYGANPGTPDGKKIYLRSFGLVPSQRRIDSETLSADRARTKPVAGNIDVAGALVAEIAPEWMGPILKHSLGTVATTGVGPYVHVIKPGTLPVGLMIEKDHGSVISGAGRYEQFNGCRIGSAEFSFPTEGYPLATFNVKGAKSTYASAPLDATYTDAGNTPFSIFEATVIEEGGSAIATVQQASITVDNGLDEGAYVIGGAGVRRRLSEGFSTVSGSLTALFEDMSLLNKAKAGTSSSLKIILSRGTGLGAAGNESIEFFVSQLVYEVGGAPIEGPAGVLVTLPFKAFRVSGADLGMSITLKNAVATI